MLILGKEKQIGTKRIYDGKILNLRVDEVEMSSNARAVREVIEHKPAVGVLAVTENDSVLLVSQFRYAVGEEMLEICAGLVEEGESFRETAVRELQEELGYYPRELEEVARFYVSPGFCEELIVLFIAKNLSPSKLEHDEDEELSAVEVPVLEIPALLKSGAIKDGKTWAALVWFLNYSNKQREY
ncbi:MAG: NUDIX hydrolase [Synergistaceae bacterium]|nr:NUDIX hydrolase [Synergistaceae bacterium]